MFETSGAAITRSITEHAIVGTTVSAAPTVAVLSGFTTSLVFAIAECTSDGMFAVGSVGRVSLAKGTRPRSQSLVHHSSHCLFGLPTLASLDHKSLLSPSSISTTTHQPSPQPPILLLSLNAPQSALRSSLWLQQTLTRALMLRSHILCQTQPSSPFPALESSLSMQCCTTKFNACLCSKSLSPMAATQL